MNLLFSITSLSYWSLLLFFMGTLCSFSALPVPSVDKAPPPIEKKASSKRQKHLNKRYQRLYKRFDQSQNSRQQLRLQKKIRQVEQQQEGRSWGIFGVIGMIGSFVTNFVSMLAIIHFSANPVLISTNLLLCLGTAILFFIFSWASFIRKKRFYDPEASKSVEITGMLMNGLTLFVLLIVAILALLGLLV